MNLGDKVLVSQILHRFKGEGTREWKPSLLPTPREGIAIGLRTLSNGTWGCDYNEGYPEGGYFYEADEYFEAVLVVFDIRESPVYAPPHCVIKLGG